MNLPRLLSAAILFVALSDSHPIFSNPSSSDLCSAVGVVSSSCQDDTEAPEIEIYQNNLTYDCNQILEFTDELEFNPSTFFDVSDNCFDQEDIEVEIEVVVTEGNCLGNRIEEYVITATDPNLNSSQDTITVFVEDSSHPHQGSFYIQTTDQGIIFESDFLDFVSTQAISVDDIEVADISEDDIYVDIGDDCDTLTTITFLYTSEDENIREYHYEFCDGCNNCVDFLIEVVFPEIEGCTDPEACNFNPEANVPDASFCDYSTTLSFTYFPDDGTMDCSVYETAEIDWPEGESVGECTEFEMTREESIEPGSCTGEFTVLETYVLTNGCCQPVVRTRELLVTDNTGPEITGEPTVLESDLSSTFITAEDACSGVASITFDEAETQPNVFERIYTATDGCGNTSTFTQIVTLIVTGCMNPNACNFDSDATVNDENMCTFGGCDDPDACNYDPDAECNDGSCAYNGTIDLSTEMTADILWNTRFELIERLESTTEYPLTAELENAEEFLSFAEVPEGLYRLRAVPDEGINQADGIFIASYPNQAYYWEDADTLEVSCGSYDQIEINLTQQNPLSGNGTVSGKIVHAGVSAQPDYSSGPPLGGVPLILVDLNTTMETLNVPAPVNYTVTDEAGEYLFDGVSAGQYSVYADVPGLPMLAHYIIDLAEGQEVENKDFYLVSDLGIYTDVILSLPSNRNSDLAVYPNPFRSALTFRLGSGLTATDLQWKICDVLGKELLSGHCIREMNCEIQATRLAPGTYVFKVFTDNVFYSAKIVKE